MNFILCVPTLNARDSWDDFLAGFAKQTVKPTQVIIIDSTSDDGTPALARKEGFRLITIARSDFRHGATRQIAVQLESESELIVYLTQDAYLANPDSLLALTTVFENSDVGCAYGRQLPRTGAGPLEAHAREFNYPATSELRSLRERQTKGFKTIFISNSFAAYRRSALVDIGGFPSDVIIGEDTCVAARMLLAGRKIAYVAEATVYHSHDYSVAQEFRRYFDTGAFHSHQTWLVKEFGGTSGEGLRYVCSELSMLWPKHLSLIPSTLLRSAAKFFGYRAGRAERWFSTRMKYRLSMHKSYWKLAGEEAGSKKFPQAQTL